MAVVTVIDRSRVAGPALGRGWNSTRRRTRLVRSALILWFCACALGSNCIQQSALTQPTSATAPGTVTLRNATNREVHLITLNEQFGASNLVQPGEARVVDVDLRDQVLDVAARTESDQVIGAIRCTISETVNGVLTATGVEIVWTAVGPSGFECRTGG